jgi:hypothetical protein
MQLEHKASTPDKLDKEAARNIDTRYNKIPRSEIEHQEREKNIEKWQKQWDNTTKGLVTKEFFSNININTDRPASYKAAGRRSILLQTPNVAQGVSLALDPTHCSCNKYLTRPHINIKEIDNQSTVITPK